MKFLSRIILLLSKKVTRKNLDHLIKQNINNIDNKKKKILNIGAGGYIQDLLESIDNTEITSIDIDLKRRPDILGDISSETVFTKIKIKPDVITCFEVLEHIKEPQKAINNLYKFSNKKTKLLFSVPFNFPIHDEPHDYYRYTKYGLEYLFKNFSNTQVIPRDGWLDTIFVFFIRL
jgi:2-polyprenyl-3-methyl-5-hydroxy-6-metoxy-1,4-benzoquinol methylase